LKEFDWFLVFLPWLPTWVLVYPRLFGVGEGGLEKNEKNSHLSNVCGSFASFRFWIDK
jgi:hypothetical protein